MMIDVPIPFVAHRIDPPSQTVETSKAEIVDMFTQSYLMRRLEIAADVLYKGKFIRGFCHLYDGQARSISHWSPIRPRRRGERRSLRTLPGDSLRPGSLAFNTRPRRLSTPLLTPMNSTPTSL